MLELWSYNLVIIRQSIIDCVGLFNWLSGPSPAVPWSIKHMHTLSTSETAKTELPPPRRPNAIGLMDNTDCLVVLAGGSVASHAEQPHTQ